MKQLDLLLLLEYTGRKKILSPTIINLKYYPVWLISIDVMGPRCSKNLNSTSVHYKNINTYFLWGAIWYNLRVLSFNSTIHHETLIHLSHRFILSLTLFLFYYFILLFLLSHKSFFKTFFNPRWLKTKLLRKKTSESVFFLLFLLLLLLSHLNVGCGKKNCAT